MKGLIKMYRRITSASNTKCTKNSSFLWAITIPVSSIFIMWICATTAHQLHDGRIVIDLDLKEYVRIRADIDKRSNGFEEKTDSEKALDSSN